MIKITALTLLLTKYDKYLLLTLSLTVFFSLSVSAQSADTLFKYGRELAYRNQFDSAIVMLEQASALQPRNMDIRLTLARVFAWNKNYPAAENIVQVVIANQPKNREAMAVLSDISLWSQNWSGLEYITFKALNPNSLTDNAKIITDSADFIKKYAIGLIEQKRYQEAANILKPFLPDMKQLWETAARKLRCNMLSLHAGYFDFKSQQQDWQTASVEYMRRQKKISLIGSLNVANRFGKQGSQLLLQAYPKIGSKAYSQLLFGYSSGKVFPNLTYGGSFFAGIARYWELEAGFRIYQVNTPLLAIPVEKATVLRGGISYQKKYFRVNYTLSKINGVGSSGLAHVLSYRHLLKDDESFFQLSLGTGSNISNQISPQFDNFAINSKIVSFTINRWLNNQWRIVGSISWEQNKDKDGIKLNRMIYDLGVSHRF